MADSILRTGTEALIPEENAKEIIQGAIAQSTVLSMFRRLPNMSSKVLSQPVLDMLPTAYFVDGDTGQKQTTKMQWSKKKITAEEIAVIVPIPEAVLDDARDNGYDIFGEVTPRVQEAFGKVIDNAILFGVNKPTSWRDGLVASAIAAGNTVTSTGDVFIDIFGENGVIAKVEEDGFIPNGVAASVKLRGKLRGLRDDNKQPLFVQNLRESSAPYALDGMPIYFAMNGVWDNTTAELIAGDFSQAVYAIRQDLTMKVLSEAVIQDAEGNIVYNLAQQDMVALRFVMRLGWEVPNPINSLNQDAATRFPFAVYQPTSGVEGQSLVVNEPSTVADLKAWLDARGISYPTDALKPDLQALYEANK